MRIPNFPLLTEVDSGVNDTRNSHPVNRTSMNVVETESGKSGMVQQFCLLDTKPY